MPFRIIISAIIMLSFLSADFIDFTGKFILRKEPNTAWCGKWISLHRIRWNKYRIEWELKNGEEYNVVLEGKESGNTIDFRKGKEPEKFGYIYSFSSDLKTLYLILQMPGEERRCTFLRTNH
jgi:hypothetical protein